MLTKKGKYALKAMVFLAGFEPGQLVPIAEIATKQQIPKKFLDAILGELRIAGFVHSRMGKGGGYTLAHSAHDIRVGHIIRAIDGRLAPLPCASQTRYQRCDDCPDETRCPVRLVMLEVRRAISGVLDGCTLLEMRTLAEQRSRRAINVSASSTVAKGKPSKD